MIVHTCAPQDIYFEDDRYFDKSSILMVIPTYKIFCFERRRIYKELNLSGMVLIEILFVLRYLNLI